MSERSADEFYMQTAIVAAETAIETGLPPIVAIVTQAGVEVGRGISGASGPGKPQAKFWNHAEFLALLESEPNLVAGGGERIVYSTLEPCLMCLGAMANAGVSRVVYGYPASADGAAWLKDALDSRAALFNLPKLDGPTHTGAVHPLMTRFVLEHPSASGADYVRGIITISPRGDLDHNSTTIDDYYSQDEWTFGSHPTPLVVELASLLDKKSKVLELAAGDGRDSFYLGKLGHHVVATDKSTVAISKIINRLGATPNLNIEPSVLDIRELSKLTGSFDAVIGITALDHLDENDLESAIQAIVQLLRPGGKLALLVHTRRDPGFSRSLDASETANWIKHYFRPDELRRRLSPHLDIVTYAEWQELDSDHGPVHEHAFASVIAVKPQEVIGDQIPVL